MHNVPSATDLSKGIYVLGVRSVAIVLVYEVVVLVSFSLQRIFASVNVGWQIALQNTQEYIYSTRL